MKNFTLCFVGGVAVALKQAMSPDFVVYQKQVVANARVRNVLRQFKNESKS
jgi:glycine/serine hydroxymethyltransferase